MLELVVPGILAGVACYGMAKGVDVYDALLVGAGKGLEILLKILPALVTLLTVVAMLRASGGLEVLADVLAPVLGWLPAAATAATPAAMHLLTAPPTAPQLLPPALRLSWAAPAP